MTATAPVAAIGAAAVSVAGGAAVAVGAVIGVDTDVRAVATLASVAAVGGWVLVAASVLTAHAGAVVWGVGGLGVAYAVAVVTGAGTAMDVRAPAVGAVLFVVAEAALWSHDLRRPVRLDRRAAADRLGWLAAVVVGTVASGGVILLVAGGAEPRWGAAAETIGVLAAAGLAVVAVSAVRRSG